MNKVILFSTLTAIMLMASCSNDEEVKVSNDGAVRFTSSIGKAVDSGSPTTKAVGTEWAANDAIGIFMVKNGVTTVVDGVENREYTTTGGGNFTATAGNEIYYPMDGSKVDFIAYYPHASGKAIGDAMDVNVSGTQTDASQAINDLLWTNTYNNAAEGFDKENHKGQTVALEFAHKLTKLVLNCKVGAGLEGADLGNMTVSIKGMNTQNTLTLATGTLGAATLTADITPRKIATAENFAASYDAIILPGAYEADKVEVTFTVNGEPFIWEVPAITFETGTEYTYEITLTRSEVLVTGTIKPWKEEKRTGIAQ